MADKSPRSGGSSLPISRVKTIMKSSPEVSAISQDSLYLISKATELFVQDLAQQTLKEGDTGNSVEYPDLAKIVNQKEALMFLQDIIPEKIKAKDYFELVGRKAPWTKENKKEETPEAVVIDDSEGEEEEEEEQEGEEERDTEEEEES